MPASIVILKTKFKPKTFAFFFVFINEPIKIKGMLIQRASVKKSRLTTFKKDKSELLNSKYLYLQKILNPSIAARIRPIKKTKIFCTFVFCLAKYIEKKIIITRLMSNNKKWFFVKK